MNDGIIFKNITMITPEGSSAAVYHDQYIAVCDGRFSYIGTSEDDAARSIGTKRFSVYDGRHKILMPPFVNSHTHLAMTLMRNRADDQPLHEWLFNTIFPLEAEMRPIDLANGTLLGIAEMIRSGTGACANMYVMHEDAMDTEIAGETGIKLNTVISGGSRKAGTDRFEPDKAYFDHIFGKYNESFDQRVRCGILIHSIYLYDKEFYPVLIDMALKSKTFIHTHLAETKKEVDDCKNTYGMTPAAAMEKFGIFDVPVIAAHCVYLNDEDISILAEKKVNVAHNPVSNLKLGSGIADIRRITDSGINVCIGTDGPASNNNLDMVQDMRIAAYLAKGTACDPQAVTAGEIIRMATINGMEALGFSQTGKIKKGWKADLQIIDTDNEHMSPVGEPLSAVVYSMKSSDVESLMIDGRILMDHRTLTTIDIEKVIYEAERSSEYLYNKVANIQTFI